MSSVAAIAGRLAGWSRHRTVWVVVLVNAAFLVPESVMLGFELQHPSSLPRFPDWGGILITLPLGLGLLALQLRLSLSFAAGQRPAGALWLLLGEVILVYLPLPWFGLTWTPMQACLVAAIAMVLPRRAAAVAIALPVVGSALYAARVGGLEYGPFIASSPVFILAFSVLYMTMNLTVPAAGMYGSAWLVRLIDALRETRAELAAVSVSRERLRLARDLHDLLGQSLSAVSLKGDLAIRLLAGDPAGARDEVESLTGLARDALHGIRAVSQDEHAVSLREETEGATTLLAAAGVQARFDLDLPDLTPAQERLLAWTVREGVTNALRHSEASSCSIRGRNSGGTIVLEVINDGASGPIGEGSGLVGLAERARTLAGAVSAGRTAPDEFRLRVEVPEGAA